MIKSKWEENFEELLKFFIYYPGVVVCFIWSLVGRHLLSTDRPGWLGFLLLSSLTSIMLIVATLASIFHFRYDDVAMLTVISIYVMMSVTGSWLLSFSK